MSEKMRDFICFDGMPGSEISSLLDLAIRQKIDPNTYRHSKMLSGKVIGLYFEKASMRTRLSFEAAVYQLGGECLYMGMECGKLGERECIKDFARAASRYLDGFVLRTFNHDAIVEMARYSSKPVINGLSDMHHPCQALGDLMTIREKLGRLDGVKIAYVGDCNNVSRSLAQSAPKVGARLAIACPKGYEFPAAFLNETGTTLSNNAAEVLKDADIVYTDVWTSMGQEKESAKRKKDFGPFQLNKDLMQHAPNAWVMHCLPAHRGEEITDEIIDGEKSIVYDQAENRMHAQRALLTRLMC